MADLNTIATNRLGQPEKHRGGRSMPDKNQSSMHQTSAWEELEQQTWEQAELAEADWAVHGRSGPSPQIQWIVVNEIAPRLRTTLLEHWTPRDWQGGAHLQSLLEMLYLCSTAQLTPPRWISVPAGRLIQNLELGEYDSDIKRSLPELLRLPRKPRSGSRDRRHWQALAPFLIEDRVEAGDTLTAALRTTAEHFHVGADSLRNYYHKWKKMQPPQDKLAKDFLRIHLPEKN